MPQLRKAMPLSAVGLAGAAGALARYGLSLAIPDRPGQFPWGTFSVNTIGCFLIGLVIAATTKRRSFPPRARLVVVSGFIGAFTTFSTYAVGVDVLVRRHADAPAVAYALASIAAGIASVVAGAAIGRGPRPRASAAAGGIS